MATNFPSKPRRGDPDAGVQVVQQNLDFLKDLFDGSQAKILRGTATVLNGNTTVVVPMGSSLSTYSISVTPTSDPGGRFWISAKTSTGFTISLSAAAGIGGVNFDWIAKGA